ncbi:unnamed protein product [Owenia fusiformis]|uniref:Uncharacterized protein n=1 Tax=Owenia fusiformis TaxID=6347 RepID=A0A8S4PA78_OWEFU|nr:unnamed protein product [Owenia fusiformis]
MTSSKASIMNLIERRLSLAFRELNEMPDNLVQKHDYRFLLELPKLTTLILDSNGLQSHVKFPTLSTLSTLWVNHNRINNLGVFIGTISKSFPNLKFLSMMNNEAAPSYFNGGSFQQYSDYRHYVISRLPKLEILDDKAVEINEREEAERIYGKHVEQPVIQEHKRRSKKKKQTHIT